MAEVLDAHAVANLAIQVGLLTPDQVQRGWDELGKRGGEAEAFLKVMERREYLTPWHSHKLLRNERHGYFLGGYRLLFRIASGSFGKVYRASDQRSGNVVAIKVLRRKWSADPHNIELFEREGRLGMTLHHGNIVNILSVSHDMPSKQFYIAMEFVEGGNLREMLRGRERLTPVEVLRILDDVATGLQYALSRGITHRDMKLTNILLSSQRTAKLVDFGLAGAWGKAHEDEESVVDRTVDYAGLERATDVPSGDTRSDIYFLGCVAYELLTGRSPLKHTRNPRERMRAARFSSIPPILPIEVGGNLDIIRLVESMMSLSPKDRFQTPSQLLDQIRILRKKYEDEPGEPGGNERPDERAQQPPAQKSLFLIEKDESLQNLLRDKLKEAGYRILIAREPIRALERFRQKPFDFLIVNSSTTGEEGLLFFDRILREAERHSLPLYGILMLSEDQKRWKEHVAERPNQTVWFQPVKLRQLVKRLHEVSAGKPGPGL